MLTKKIRRLIKSAGLFILFLIALLLLANQLVQRPNVQAYLVKRLSDLTEFNISTGKIELNLLHGIGISVDDFTALPEKGPEEIFVSKLRIILKPEELLKLRIVPDSIYLVKPSIKLYHEQIKLPQDATGNVTGRGLHPIWHTGIEKVYIESGQMTILDKGVEVENLNLNIRKKESEEPTLLVSGRGRTVSRGEKIPFNVRGNYLAGTEEEIDPYLDFTVETGKASVNALPVPQSLSIASGYFHTDLRIKGRLSEAISLNGKIFLNKLNFIFSANDRKKQFSFDNSELDFTSLISESSISIPQMEIKAPGKSFSLKLALERYNRENPYLDLEIESSFLDSPEVKAVWPSPIMYPWFDEKLLPVLESGKVQLSKFTARGDMEQFRNLHRPENRSVFELRLDCRDLVFAGEGIPLPFEKVSGTVFWKDSDFFIEDVTAEFGKSAISNAGLSMNSHISGSWSVKNTDRRLF